jgi:hypothetical protein
MDNRWLLSPVKPAEVNLCRQSYHQLKLVAKVERALANLQPPAKAG